jgi:dTDP-4-amino-4,6-dideoxygalactose transaminase
LHRHAAAAGQAWAAGHFPRAEQWARQCLSLPMYVSMTREQVDAVIGAVHDFFAEGQHG